MKVNKANLSVIIGAAWMLSPSAAHAHGYAIFPEARQSICYNDGSFWSGNHESEACKATYDISGSYPFVQRNEVAINIPAPHYNDFDKVKEYIPDGTLCAANDHQKRGLDIEHTQWTRTELAPGTFEYVFQATAPHNPSFWEIYLTKPGVDVTKPLNWDDLELISEHGDIAVDGEKKYRMQVTIPADHSGDAILYTRWQREDPVGEGFYNCSDIVITGDGGNPPVDPDEPYLVKGERFIPVDVELTTPELGDQVKYEVFNAEGQLHGEFSVTITEDNTGDWDRLLAAEVNGYYDALHGGNVFVGDWHAEMNHYMYFRDALHSNYFNSKDGLGYGEFSIVSDETPNDLEAVVTAMTLANLVEARIKNGELVVLHPNNSVGEFDSVEWVQLSGEHVEYSTGRYSELFIDTEQLDAQQDHELTFRLTVSNSEGSDTTVYSFVVEGEGDTTPPPSEGDWSASAVYVQGDVVTHGGRSWTAQWWTQGEEPGTTGEWGVWR
ncbi:lytic polysaccharide monooxygenase [Vibrio astriarenae]|uniref:lytic polysaccharide monooxygenase n=1 Tax=Vibrio astriarenae TaxID=1481923 RepID=UPI003735370D